MRGMEPTRPTPRVDLETVGWVDLGGFPTFCPRCAGKVASRTLEMNVRPVTAYEAECENLSCTRCGEPLEGVAYDGARVPIEEWAVA